MFQRCFHSVRLRACLIYTTDARVHRLSVPPEHGFLVRSYQYMYSIRKVQDIWIPMENPIGICQCRLHGAWRTQSFRFRMARLDWSHMRYPVCILVFRKAYTALQAIFWYTVYVIVCQGTSGYSKWSSGSIRACSRRRSRLTLDDVIW